MLNTDILDCQQITAITKGLTDPRLEFTMDIERKCESPLTNRGRGPYRKLRNGFFPIDLWPKRGTRAMNRRGKNEDP